MLTKITRASVLRRAAVTTRRLPQVQRRFEASATYISADEYDKRYPTPGPLPPGEDPELNGGYINPPFKLRQFREPSREWFDPSERRNFGEKAHEREVMLQVFSPYRYDIENTAHSLGLIACFVAAVLTLSGAIYMTYPDKPSVPREFEGGLERELGGSGTPRARVESDVFELK